MSETVIQVDGKIKFVVPGAIKKAVVIPGKLVNLLTEIPDPEKCITEVQGIKNGKYFRKVTFGSKVKKKLTSLSS